MNLHVNEFDISSGAFVLKFKPLCKQNAQFIERIRIVVPNNLVFIKFFFRF